MCGVQVHHASYTAQQLDSLLGSLSRMCQGADAPSSARDSEAATVASSFSHKDDAMDWEAAVRALRKGDWLARRPGGVVEGDEQVGPVIEPKSLAEP